MADRPVAASHGALTFHAWGVLGCFSTFSLCFLGFFWQTSHESPENALKSATGGQKNLPRQLAVFVAEPVLTGSDPKKHCFFF